MTWHPVDDALHEDAARLLAETTSVEASQPTELNQEAEEFDFGL